MGQPWGFWGYLSSLFEATLSETTVLEATIREAAWASGHSTSRLGHGGGFGHGRGQQWPRE
eukprot:1286725-Pyramimonas_sp.AAC.1